jgi:hypothetical protein
MYFWARSKERDTTTTITVRPDISHIEALLKVLNSRIPPAFIPQAGERMKETGI